MSTEICETLFRRIDEILDQESVFLKQGQWDNIEALAQMKLEAFSGLQKHWPHAAQDRLYNIAAHVQRKAKRIELLQKSVLSGLKFARQKLSEIQTQSAKIGTYEMSGAQMFLPEDNFFEEKKV